MKKFLLLIYIAVFSFNAFAQNPLVKQWDKRFGGKQDERLSCFQQTRDGGYILGGWSVSDSSGNKTTHNWNPNGFSNDYWIVKLNATGHKQWEKDFGGTFADELTAILQTHDGGYIFAGYSQSDSSGDKTQNLCPGTINNSDYWIIKADSLGNKQWDKDYGGPDVDYLTSIYPTKDGGYILGGASYSGIGCDKSESTWGSFDYWIVKIDSLGNKQWDKNFGGTGAEDFSTIAQTVDGGYILGGSSQSDSTGDKTQNIWGTWKYDFWIVKTDSIGNKQWDRDFGGIEEDALATLFQTADNGYILGGGSESGINGDKTQNTWGSHDYWVLKIDSLGNKEWDKDFGGNSSDYLISISQTIDGRYLLTGISNSIISGDKTENNFSGSDGQIWTIKTDSLWNKLWDKTILKYGDDIMGLGAQTTDGCYAFVTFTDGGIGGYKSQKPFWDNGRPSDDYWIIKFCDSTLTTNSPTLTLPEGDGIFVSPNPANDFVNISFTTAEKNLQIELVDLFGRKVFDSSIFNLQSSMKIDIQNLPQGIYILEIKGATVFYKTKVVKQ
jgi:hypothetical protein